MQLDNKRILVTGGHGFLGKYVVRALRLAKAKTILTPSHKGYDLVQRQDVSRMFEDLAPDVIIHLAAEVGGIGANQKTPGRFFYANMAMGLNLIEEARLRKIDKFVQVGTVCAYPKHCPVPFHETDLFNGYPEETNAAYGLAKRTLLVMLQAYRQQYDFNGIYLIPVNLYGPGDNFSLDTGHVIPALIRKFMAGTNTVKLWGDGLVSREFLYVEDAARAIVAATEDYDGGEPVNIGTGNEIRIDHLATKIAKLTEYEGRIEWDGSMPNGQPRRCLDTSRARDWFGFQATTTLSYGLLQTIEWWRECVAAG